MSNSTNCPACNGTGKKTITFRNLGSKETSVHEIKCFYCEGEILTPKQAKEVQQSIDYEKQMWCKCGNPSKQTTFHKDGNKITGKHCWTCNDCKKVRQIG